jgi:uncharacterized repeat protein (TIGR03803 family)
MNAKQLRDPISILRQPAAMAALGFAVLTLFAAQSVRAQTFSVLYHFNGSDGSTPLGRLTLDAAGNLYGTTYLGGTGGFGTIFKLDGTGKLTVLHNFTGGTDGGNPFAGVIRDSDGNLYGAASGGALPKCGGGCGTVFKLDTSGTLTTLYMFKGGTDGFTPDTRLVFIKGELYGTTKFGGNCSHRAGCGVIFKVTQAGKETVLYRFTGRSDGLDPRGVIPDRAGNLYGTTHFGGQGGAVFKLDTSRHLTVLDSFTGQGDGGGPLGRLIRDTNGILHGTTQHGGDPNCPSGGCGVAFTLDGAGKEFVMHAFGQTSDDGTFPFAGFVDNGNGTLYGTTARGGINNCREGCGTVYRFLSNGSHSYTVLYRFTGGADGHFPQDELIWDAAGNLYGTAGGGQPGYGVIFKITP